MQDVPPCPEHSKNPDGPSIDKSSLVDAYLTVEDVQRQIKRSRASVYRYANTDPKILNPPFEPYKLNPEIRNDRDEPLKFHPQEVSRFARDVLGLTPTIAVHPSEETTTHELLRAILVELKAIRKHLETR